MLNKLSFKTLLPHLVAIITFLVITLIFFHPVVFEGKVMTQNDIIQGVSSGQEVSQFRKETGEEALWTNSMFGGMPAYLINVYWGGDITRHVHNLLSLYLPSPARYSFLGMFCFYLLLLAHRVNPYLAIGGGIAYGLNSFLMISIEAGHIWKVAAITYMPLVLAGVQLILRKKLLLGVSLTATAVALLIRSNHIQIAYYLFIILLVFWVVYLIDAAKSKAIPAFAKTTMFLAIAGLLGIGANLGKLWTSYEYSPYTIRGKSELQSNNQSTSGGLDRDYAFAWSNGIAESFTFVMPYFYGGASSENVGMKSTLAEDLRKAGAGRAQIDSISKQVPTYWGDQPFTSGPIYPGVVVMFLFVLGILVVKGPLRNWLVAATAIGFILSWGKNLEWFNYLVFDYFPLYNKFRAVSMTLVIPLVCIPLLAFIGLSKFLEEINKKTLFRAFLILGGLLLLLLISSAFMNFRGANDAQISQQVLLDAIINQRGSMFRSSALRSLFFVLLSAGLIYLFFLQKVGKGVLIGGLAFVIFLDLYLVDKNYLDKEKFVRNRNIAAYKPDAADNQILQDNAQFRVANLTVNIFNDATTSYYHSSVGGYHGAKLRRYQDLIEYHLNGELQEAIAQIQNRSFTLSGIPALNMLNTKYFKLGNAANAILPNSSALGNAWFVEQIQSVSTPDEAINAIGSTDISKVAISEKLDEKRGLSVGSISLTSYEPNHLTYNSTNEGDGFVVFSEIFYEKGWKAFIDGNEAKIHQVNYVLRGLDVPAGNHTIEFRFSPRSYTIGNTAMLVFSLLSIGLLVFSLVVEVKRSND